VSSEQFQLVRDGVTLTGEHAGEGPAVVLLHGLTATRRYVVMGSRLLERDGHRVISYDARGHGHSSAAAAYDYEDLMLDLLAVLDELGVDRAVLAGVSMGSHTILRLALDQPERVAGLVVITPSFDGTPVDAGGKLDRWDALAAGLRSGGIDGFVDAYDLSGVETRLRDTIVTVIRQRMALHDDLGAIADALEAVPRSRPFETLDELAGIDTPVAIVASNDGADPEHPQVVGEAYAALIPGARLVLDTPGASPTAWQGSQLSKIIAETAAAGR
jgi:pimeloyl-ACP methyl ester carboxylesterase